jgi:hypothetical protein
VGYAPLIKETISAEPCPGSPLPWQKITGRARRSSPLGVQHDFNKTGFSDRPLQHKDIVVGAKIHGLRDDAIFGMRLPADRLPPKVFPAKFRDRFLCGVIRHHAP